MPRSASTSAAPAPPWPAGDSSSTPVCSTPMRHCTPSAGVACAASITCGRWADRRAPRYSTPKMRTGPMSVYAPWPRSAVHGRQVKPSCSGSICCSKRKPRAATELPQPRPLAAAKPALVVALDGDHGNPVLRQQRPGRRRRRRRSAGRWTWSQRGRRPGSRSPVGRAGSTQPRCRRRARSLARARPARIAGSPSARRRSGRIESDAGSLRGVHTGLPHCGVHSTKHKANVARVGVRSNCRAMDQPGVADGGFYTHSGVFFGSKA